LICGVEKAIDLEILSSWFMIYSTPVESMDTILIMGSCVPLERLLLKTKTKNKTKKRRMKKKMKNEKRSGPELNVA